MLPEGGLAWGRAQRERSENRRGGRLGLGLVSWVQDGKGGFWGELCRAGSQGGPSGYPSPVLPCLVTLGVFLSL